MLRGQTSSCVCVPNSTKIYTHIQCVHALSALMVIPYIASEMKGLGGKFRYARPPVSL